MSEVPLLPVFALTKKTNKASLPCLQSRGRDFGSDCRGSSIPVQLRSLNTFPVYVKIWSWLSGESDEGSYSRPTPRALCSPEGRCIPLASSYRVWTVRANFDD